MSRLLFLFCFSGERIVLFEESREIYIPKAISLAKVALRLIERISNVKTERGNKDVVTILIEGEKTKQTSHRLFLPERKIII